MIGKITLTDYNEYEFSKYKLLFDFNGTDYTININTDLSEDYEKLISSTNELEKSIAFDIDFLKDFPDENSKEIIKLLEEARQGNLLDYLTKAEYVEFVFDTERILEYLNNNPILKTKKIVLNQNIELNESSIKEIESKYKEYTESLYFKLPENDEYISFEEYKNTVKALKQITDEIKQFDFSPFEQVMYAYDLVRNRVYNMESQKDNKSLSRDLSSSLLGDKIVCLGYSRIFNAILEQLNIDCREVILIALQTGHARNEVYIKDEKYNIDGVYYFDTTWDSRRKDDYNKYLYSYRYFAKTRMEFDEIDNKRYKNQDFPFYTPEISEELKREYDENGLKNQMYSPLIKSVNYISKRITGKYLIKPITLVPSSPFYKELDIEKSIKELDKLVTYFDKPIPADTFIKALYNIRKQQYYMNPEKYPFSLNDFYKTVIISNWKFEQTPEERLISLLTGKKENNSTKDKMLLFNSKNRLGHRIEEIHLTKTLRKILDKKTSKKED